MRRDVRVRAPELAGRGGWIGVDRPLSLAALRGKVVLLDFWTFCCINCLHVLDELRPLEERFADVLVTIGVHSPKFVHEADHAAVEAACARYDVHHPVIDDPDLTTWKQYAVKAWPTLAVVDPEGYLVSVAAGEGHAHGLASLIEDLVAEHEAAGTLVRGAPPFTLTAPDDGPLRFPGGVLSTDHGLLVADSGHHRLVLLDDDGNHLRVIGDGVRGLVDGPAETARFSEPAGMCLLPDGAVLVADTVNHALRQVDLATGDVRTVAGTGAQWRTGPAAGPALEVALSSPWDLVWFDDRVVVAMAGTHQLYAYDVARGLVGPYSGTGVEGLRDGATAEAWHAQPSGLSVSPDGQSLFVADSETSAVRVVRDGQVSTLVGTGLFDFGHRDGAAADARFQHPLGVLATDDAVLVCDTYNGALRRIDLGTREVSTVVRGLLEPAQAALHDGELVVVESGAHRVVRPLLAAQSVDEGAQRTERPPTTLRSGPVALQVVFEAAKGQHLDERYGPATRLTVSASPPGALVEGAGTSTGLARDLVLTDDADGAVLHVTALAATCDEGVEHAACHMTQQDWGIPLQLAADGPQRLALVLRGLDA